MVALPPLRIVYWTKVFGDTWNGDAPRKGTELAVNNCPLPENDIEFLDGDAWCFVTSNTDNIQDAAAIVFHARDYDGQHIPPTRTPYQPWILLSMESPINPHFRQDPLFMNQTFEYLASYHRKSRFLFPYFSPNIMDVMNQPVVPKDLMATKTGSAPILWIASNCDAWSGRHHYVQELMKYIQVDSYGKCLNNKAFPPESDTDRNRLMAQYKFYLAIENSNCDDYVTEKLYDTFYASTVPIVDGPTSYDGFIPTERAVIRMDAYPDPRELADYIRYLDGNDTAYLEYFAFRREADKVPPENRVSPAFLANWGSWSIHDRRAGWCGVCRGTAPWWRARHDPEYQLVNDTLDYLRADETCASQGKWNYAREGPPYIPNWKPTLSDEFTRPWIKKRLPLYVSPDGARRNSDYITVRSIWTMYTLVSLSFFLFLILLIQKRNRGLPKP